KASSSMKALRKERKSQERSVQKLINNYEHDAESSQRDVEAINAIIEADATAQERSMRTVQSDLQRQLFTNVNHLESILANSASEQGTDAHRSAQLLRSVVADHQIAVDQENVRASGELGEGQALVTRTADDIGGHVTDETARMKLKIDRILWSGKSQLSDGKSFISSAGRKELLTQKQIADQFTAEERNLLFMADADLEHLSKEDKAKLLALADRLESESTRMSEDFGSFGTALSGLDAGAATTKAELSALASEEGRLTAKMAAFSTRGQNVIAADKIYGTQLLGGLKSQTARYASESAGALGALALQEKNNASKSVTGYMSLMERRFGATRGALLREEAEARSQYGVEKNDVDK
ncbi:hypothetical protein FOZ62_005873, partial [Perkinsus olseni]